MIRRISIILVVLLAFAATAFATDQRIQYTEEMVGANHPSKSDTLNRLNQVEADIDGHGKVRFLKEQSTTPTVPTDEGALYTADDGGETVLYYRADGESAEVARPGLGLAPPGYIAGLQISRSGDTAITIQPGAVEIDGKLYVLESAVTITVSVTASLYWRGIQVSSLPSAGNVLASTNFSDCAATNITKNSNGTYWQYVGYSTRRVIGMYPAVDSAIISGFRVYGDKYYCYTQVIDDGTPPTTSTTYGVGLPVTSDSAGMIGHYIASANATGGGARLAISSGIVMLQAGGDYVAGWLHLRSTDGQASFMVTSTGGTANDFDVRLYYMDIPAGMAR